MRDVGGEDDFIALAPRLVCNEGYKEEDAIEDRLRWEEEALEEAWGISASDKQPRNEILHMSRFWYLLKCE